MSDRSEWLQGIADKLANSLGTREQRAEAFFAAKEMEANLPPEGAAWSATLKRMFEHWIDQMRYLSVPLSPDHDLPESLLRPDIEVAREYGLTSKAAIQAKQEQISACRDARISRAVSYMRSGWTHQEAVCFCGAKDEWRMAGRQAERAAA